MPRIFACGGRRQTFDAFMTAHVHARKGDFVAMLVDSEDPMEDVGRPWEHLAGRKGDAWARPEGADADQVLLMTTCMETWIVADQAALKSHFAKLAESALPSLVDLESRDRHAIQDALMRATKNCSNAYQKGKRSFAVLAALDPVVLKERLPSFRRMLDVLDRKLQRPTRR